MASKYKCNFCGAPIKSGEDKCSYCLAEISINFDKQNNQTNFLINKKLSSLKKIVN